MRSYRASELGNLSNFKLEEVPPPKPASDEILLKVEAVSLGYVDQLVMRALYQVKPTVPYVPGGEIVGVVEEVGVNVTRFTIGQRIAAWQIGGGLAEKAVVAAKYAVPVPEGLAAAKAAAQILDYVTAYYGLYDRGALQSGQTLLVAGASGGVGSAAVQVAVAGGAVVVGLASTPRKIDFVSSIGASLVIDYMNEGWRETLKANFPDGIDRVFDTVGGNLFQLCFRSLAKLGSHLVVGFASDDGIRSLPANLTILKSGGLVGVDARYLWESDPGRFREILAIVMRMAEQGSVNPIIAKVFDLEDASSAVELLTSKDRLGKVVITP